MKGLPSLMPCLASLHGDCSANGISATMDTVNQDADRWHVALVWLRQGSLSSLSERVAAPLTFSEVITLLKQQLRSLVVVGPR